MAEPRVYFSGATSDETLRAVARLRGVTQGRPVVFYAAMIHDSVEVRMPIKLEDITESVVVQLNVDVTNPKPDKRSRDWFKLPTIKAGSRFLLTPHLPPPADLPPGVPDVAMVRITVREFCGGGRCGPSIDLWAVSARREAARQRIDGSDLVEAMLPHLYPVEASVGTVLATVGDVYADARADAVLAHLVDAGAISLASIRAAANVHNAMSEDEWVAFSKRHDL